MKKLNLLLLALLCSVGLALADDLYTWDFTLISTSDYPSTLNSTTNIDYWSKYSSNRTNYLGSATGALQNATIKKDADNDFQPTFGLTFDLPQSSTIIRFQTSGNEGISSNGSGVYVNVPIAEGQQVKITAKTTNTSNTMAITGADGVTSQTLSTSYEEYTFTPTTDAITNGSMKFQIPNKCSLQKIVIAEASGKQAVPADDFKWSASSATVFTNQVSPVLPSLTNTLSLSVSYSSSNTSVASINATTGAITIEGVGTTVISAVFAGDATYDEKTVTYTLNVKAPEVIVNGARVWDYTTAAPSTKPDNGLYYNSTCSDAAGSNNGLKGIKLDGSGFAYFHTPGVAGTLYITFGIRKNSDAAQIAVYTDDTKATQIGEPLTQEGAPAVDTKSVAISAENTTIYIARSSGETVITKIVWIPNVSLTANNGWASYSNAEGVQVSGAKAYTAKVNGAKDAVILTELTDGKIPANTGVVLKADGATEATFVPATVAAIDPATNDLVAAGDVPAESLVIGTIGGVTAFYALSAAATVANKAYLPANLVAADKPVSIVFADEVTAVEDVRPATGIMYDIMGRQIANPVAGQLYIVDGVKYIAK